MVKSKIQKIEEKPEKLSKVELIKEYKNLDKNFIKLFNNLKEIEEITENLPIGIIGLDKNGIITFENPKLKEIIGLKKKQTSKAMGWKITEMENVVATGITGKINELLKGKEFQDFIAPFKSIYGKETVLCASGIPLFDNNGNIDSALLLLEDITEKKKAEDKLKETEKKYRQLVEHSQLGIIMTQGIPLNLIYANPTALEVIGYTLEELQTFSKEELRALVHPDDQVKLFKMYKDGINGKFIPKPHQFRILHKDGSMRWVESITGQVKYKGKTTLQSFVKDITDVMWAKEELKRMEHEKSIILDSMSELVSYQDTKMRVVWANKAAADSIGLKAKELTGKYCYELWQKRKKPCKGCPVVKSYKTGKLEKGEMTTPDGRIWIVKGIPVKNENNKIVGLVETTQDITEQKQAEHAILESEKRFRDISHSMADWIWEVDENGIYTHCSEKIQNILGFTSKEIIGKTPFDLMPKEEKKKIREIFLKLAKKKEPIKDLENWNITKDGKKICLLTNGMPIFDKQGIFKGYRGVDKDITMRKKSDEQIRLLSSLVKQSTEGIAMSDMEGNLLFVNNAFAAIHGYTPNELIGKKISIFHTAEQMLIVQEANRQIQDTGKFHGEILHVKRDGIVFPTIWHNSLLRDENGNPIGMIATLRDITLQKKLEKQIKEHSQDLEKKVKERTIELELEKQKYKSLFEDSNDPIYLIDPKTNNILDCNYKAKTSCKCGLEECCNKKFHKIYLKEDKNIIQKLLNKAFKKRNANFISETSFEDYNKQIYLETNLTLIEYGKQKIIQAICRDISEGKKIEEEIMKKSLKYELDKGFAYLIDEPVLDESLDVFNNLLDCGFSGFIFSRTKPEILKRNTPINVDIFWLAKKEINNNSIQPNILEIESKIEKLSRGNNVILIDRFDYLLSKNSFLEILEFLQRLNEFIYIQKWILLISIDSRTISKKEVNLLKKEAQSVKPKLKIELEKKNYSVLKYINIENKLGKMPSITEIAVNFKITRKTARKRIDILENRGLIGIIISGRQKLLEITNKGKESF